MGSQGKSRGVSNSMQRVKVYRLNDDGKWDDRGTGHVSVDYMERSEDLGLYVIDEEDNNTLLAHRISSDEIYRRQEDTIISWRDPEFSTELALSFQEAVGCSYIWDHICSVQRNLQFSTLSNLEIGPRPATDNREASRTSQVNVATLVVHVAVLDNLYLADDVRPVILGMGSCKLSSDETLHSVNSELRELPPVELSTLPLIVKCEGVLGFGECSYRSSCSRELGDWMLTVVESCGADQMRVAELIIQDAFFHKLMDLFRICEDLENIDGLHIVYKLVKGIILLNNPQIFERIFGDEFIMDIIGTLEYDPDVPQVQQHRAFLKEHVVYKEAIPIKDPSVLSKIHQTYRIGYIKDVILPRVLDEATVANLNSITHANNAVVVSLLKDDSTFIQELFARMRSPGTSLESKKNLVLFLHEFCSLGKSLQLAQQLRLFRDLANEGIFDIITGMFQSHDKVLVLTGTDILILFLNQDPNLLRTYVIQQEGNSLLGLLIKGMISDFGEDMHCQFLEIIRILLDSYTLSGSQRDAIVEVFYEKHMEQLIDVLTSSCSPKGIARTSSQSAKLAGSGETQAVAKPEILSNICELLCFCVLHHPYRIKCNFLLNNVIEKILLLTHRKEKYLIVAAVRFLRTVISRNDDYLLRHIVKNNLLKPVIDAFIANGNRYNLLNSAVLELFEYIRKENLKHLIRYIVDCFWDQLEKFEYLDAIRSLKLKYEQSLENCQTRHSRSNMVDPRKRIDDRALEKEEEDYFNEDSDEEDSASARVSQKPNPPTQPVLVNGTSGSYPSLRSGSIGLVDYEDDDDDDCATPLGSKREISTAPDKIMDSPTLKRKLASRTDPNDKELELTKKQILDKNSNISAIAVAAGCSTCSPTQSNKEDLPNPHNAAAGNNVSEEAQNEKEPAVRRGCFNCMSNTEDVRQAIGEDHTSINNSASDIVTNGPKVTGSEAYSVR